VGPYSWSRRISKTKFHVPTGNRTPVSERFRNDYTEYQLKDKDINN